MVSRGLSSAGSVVAGTREAEDVRVPREWIHEGDSSSIGGHSDSSSYMSPSELGRSAGAALRYEGSASSMASFSEHASTLASADDRYDVVLDTSKGLGLKLGWTKSKQIIVTGFKPLADGSVGPAEASGRIAARDVLVAVEGEDVVGQTFGAVGAKIKACAERVTLGFKPAAPEVAALAMA